VLFGSICCTFAWKDCVPGLRSRSSPRFHSINDGGCVHIKLAAAQNECFDFGQCMCMCAYLLQISTIF
jgi:hypothetical protein